MKEKIVDLGCGANKYPGSIGIDRLKLKGVDIVRDVESSPLPLKDNSFDKVVAYNFLEHLEDTSRVFKEVYRILKVGGIFHFEVPHYSSVDMFTDPTHKSFFSYRSVEYYVKGHKLNEFKYFPDIRFEIINREILFWGSKRFIDLPQQIIFNKIPRFYERKLAWVFPAHQLSFTLRKVL